MGAALKVKKGEKGARKFWGGEFLFWKERARRK